MKCPVCRGTGLMAHKKRIITCTYCKGHGFLDGKRTKIPKTKKRPES